MQNSKINSVISTNKINFAEYLHQKQIVISLILSIIAITGCVILTLVFPIYYNSQFHFNIKYSSLIKRSNKAINEVGVVQAYLDQCYNKIYNVNDDNSYYQWCDTILNNIEPNLIAYQTTKDQQKLQLSQILSNEQQLIENVFFCNNISSTNNEPKYCICNYYDGSTVQYYNQLHGVSIQDELKSFCASSNPKIYNNDLVNQMENFIEK